MSRAHVWSATLALALASCDAPPLDGPRYLSEWGLFSDPANQIPAAGVIPYEINAPLFSDYAAKHRFIRLPAGETITVGSDGRWSFPDGTVVVKTFGFYVDARDPTLGERLIETRLLVREAGVWQPLVYRWNEAETDAELMQAGARVEVSIIDDAGAARAFTYRVPNRNQCTNCHGGTEEIEILGVRTDQMDHTFDFGAGPENQIDHMASLGAFAVAPPRSGARGTMVDYDDETAPLEARARAYLHANCAHCHREGGGAAQSGLWLDVSVTEPVRLGICKPPAAAGRGTGGRSVAVWPGDASRSIMTFRMASTEPGIKMPELPTVLAHDEGVALITAWIDAMEPRDCGM